MKKRILFLMAMLMVVLLLAGCLDIEEDIVINDDGSGSFRLAMVMDASVASMMEEGESEPLIDESDFPDAEAQSYIDPEGNYVDEVVIQFDDLETFVSEFNASSEDGGVILEYQDLGGTILFTHTIEGSDDNTDGALGDAGDLIGAEMLEGLEWKLSITAPNIVDTNGALSEDSTTANWRIPLTLLSMPDGHEAYVEYSTGGFSFPDNIGGWLIALCFGIFVMIGGLLSLIGVVFFIRRSKKKTE